MPVPSQGHYGFHSFPVVDWFCLFKYLWGLTFPLEDCSEFGNFVITLISEVCDLGHVGHVTYSFINMLFISTGIFDVKLRPQIVSVGSTENSPLSLYNVYINIIYLNLLSILATV
jgi:hypothetical protein